MRWALFVLLLAGALAGVALAQSNRFPSSGKGGTTSASGVQQALSTSVVVVGASPYKIATADIPQQWMADRNAKPELRTTGGRFYVTIPAKVTGVRFRWFSSTFGATFPTSVKCSLWDTDPSFNGTPDGTPVRIAAATLSTVAMNAANDCSFGSGIAIAPYHRYEVTVVAVTGGSFTYFAFSSVPEQRFTLPLASGINFVWLSWSRWALGDTSTNNNDSAWFFPVEPLLGVVGG